MYVRYEPSYGEEPAPTSSYKTSRDEYDNYERVTPKRVANKAYSTAGGGSSAQNASKRDIRQRNPHKSGRNAPAVGFPFGRRPSSSGKNPIFGFIPPSVYNPETKKVFGFLKAEDILLVGLILLLLESDNNDEPMLIYILLFVLLADYIDFSSFGL